MALYTVDNMPDEIPFHALNDVERTLQNVKNLLRTRKGEIPYDRLRGFDTGLYDLPITKMREKLPEEIDRVLLWEPDARARTATAEILPDGSTRITVVVEIAFA